MIVDQKSFETNRDQMLLGDYGQVMDAFNPEVKSLIEKYNGSQPEGDLLEEPIFILHPNRLGQIAEFSFRDPDALPEDVRREIVNLFFKHFG